ncbi:MAG: hypothetical protein M9947_15730 [Thermomicrobiales bacterium]|nr:hypothetical protein [Thermomicrobiales bacterium]
MSHTFDLGTRITRRAALKGLAASGAMAGLAWSPLAAQEREVGEGSVSTMPENAQVVPGDVLTVAGTGFAQRPADGYIDFIMDDHLVTTDDGEDIHLEIPGSELDADGNFTVEIPVPLGISEGQHWVRALAGLDGGDPVSKIALFTVVAAATDGTPVAATDAAITGEATAMDDSSVRVRLTGSNLESGAVITAAFGGEPVELSGRGVQPPVTIGDDGSLGVNADIAPGLAPTGDHTLEVTIVGADGTEVVTVPFTVTPFIGLDPTDQGVDTTLTIAALQPGASIESVTAGDLVFETLPAIADDLGIVSLATSLPLELPLGEVEITVTQSAPEAATYTGSASITPSNALFGTEKFVARTAILDASSGQPYQSAYSSVNNAVFVTTAGGQGPGGSNIFKLDADTLEPLGQVAVAEDYPAFGLGLDDANGNVWVTNTRQNTAAIYSQADLPGPATGGGCRGAFQGCRCRCRSGQGVHLGIWRFDDQSLLGSCTVRRNRGDRYERERSEYGVPTRQSRARSGQSPALHRQYQHTARGGHRHHGRFLYRAHIRWLDKRLRRRLRPRSGTDFRRQSGNEQCARHRCGHGGHRRQYSNRQRRIECGVGFGERHCLYHQSQRRYGDRGRRRWQRDCQSRWRRQSQPRFGRWTGIGIRGPLERSGRSLDHEAHLPTVVTLRGSANVRFPTLPLAHAGLAHR